MSSRPNGQPILAPAAVTGLDADANESPPERDDGVPVVSADVEVE